jgi:hypothetical protein
VNVPHWIYTRAQGQEQRCNNPKTVEYQNYGARGIQFKFDGVNQAAHWIAENLGIPEDRSLQLDRINNDGHYEPGNLRWSTASQNMAHTRTRSLIVPLQQFRQQYPKVMYADATLRNMLGMGLTFEQIAERFSRPSCKPKGKYGTFSTVDPFIVSLPTEP